MRIKYGPTVIAITMATRDNPNHVAVYYYGSEQQRIFHTGSLENTNRILDALYKQGYYDFTGLEIKERN